jgi:hypothetical protein
MSYTKKTAKLGLVHVIEEPCEQRYDHEDCTNNRSFHTLTLEHAGQEQLADERTDKGLRRINLYST